VRQTMQPRANVLLLRRKAVRSCKLSLLEGEFDDFFKSNWIAPIFLSTVHVSSTRANESDIIRAYSHVTEDRRLSHTLDIKMLATKVAALSILIASCAACFTANGQGDRPPRIVKVKSKATCDKDSHCPQYHWCDKRPRMIG